MADVPPSVTLGSDYPGVRAIRRAVLDPSVPSSPGSTSPEPAPIGDRPRRSLAWADLPAGPGRLSEVRRRLRVLQVERAAFGRGIAA
ncbi:hypothetical protein [Nakamurella deserti]|uniref:hypothetical protein n=1 Tax=Nakamurella deserti TaxID=2164074 RepID=UPI000DBEA570|nr:hypothetical protein [Nakamurella deserti]